jgi:hypothetical protein
MAIMWDKQPASRFIKYQNLSWAGSGVVLSTGFASQTYQIRVASQVAGARTMFVRSPAWNGPNQKVSADRPNGTTRDEPS